MNEFFYLVDKKIFIKGKIDFYLSFDSKTLFFFKLDPKIHHTSKIGLLLSISPHQTYHI